MCFSMGESNVRIFCSVADIFKMDEMSHSGRQSKIGKFLFGSEGGCAGGDHLMEIKQAGEPTAKPKR